MCIIREFIRGAFNTRMMERESFPGYIDADIDRKLENMHVRGT